jgi:replicative DNA helicase
MLTSPSFKTGFSLLDDEVILDPGQLIVLAGRPGDGKTELAMNLVSRAHPHASVMVNSGELSTHELMRWLISLGGNIPAEFIRHSWLMSVEQFSEMKDAVSNLQAAPITFANIFDLDRLEKAIAETKPELVVIDYLNLFIQPDDWRGTRAEYVTLVAKELARMARARDHKTVILLLMSLGRVGSTDGIPIGMKDAGGAEENADTVLIVGKDDEGQPLLKISKNRGGPSFLAQRIIRDEKTRAVRGGDVVPYPGIRSAQV